MKFHMLLCCFNVIIKCMYQISRIYFIFFALIVKFDIMDNCMKHGKMLYDVINLLKYLKLISYELN